jgi:hypothetical protein
VKPVSISWRECPPQALTLSLKDRAYVADVIEQSLGDGEFATTELAAAWMAEIKNCNLPADEVIAWCSAMLDNDRVGFIAKEQLQSLRTHFQTAAR